MKAFLYTVLLISIYFICLDNAVITHSTSTIIDLKSIIDAYMDEKYSNILYNPGIEDGKKTYNNECNVTLINIINKQNHTTKQIDDLKNQLDDMRNQLVKANLELEFERIQQSVSQNEMTKIQNLLEYTINELKNTRNELHDIKKDYIIQKNDFQIQIENIRNQQDNTKRKLINQTNLINDNKHKVVSTKNHLDDTINELKNTRNELHYINKDNTIQKNDFQFQIDNIKNQLDDTKKELINKTNFINDNKHKVVIAKNNLDNTIEELKNTRNDLQSYNNNIGHINLKLSESNPVGAIAFFARQTAPKGWLEANGQEVSRLTYADLFISIGTNFGNGQNENTFKLPDLRGEFIRGWSNGRDVDSGRDFGTFQWGSIIPMAGYIDDFWSYVKTTGHSDHWNFVASAYDEGFEKNVPIGHSTHGTTFPASLTDYFISPYKNGRITTWNVMKGTRPRNIALLACIKH